MGHSNQGFTLLEFLIVLAIVGVLMGISTMNYLRWRASSTVMQAAQQFAREITNTRTGAKRAGQCWEIRLTGNATAATKYQVRKADGSSCSATATYTTQDFELPPGTSIALDATSPTLNKSAIGFSPPYGTTTADPVSYKVKWQGGTEIMKTVRVTSVLGKVIIQ